MQGGSVYVDDSMWRQDIEHRLFQLETTVLALRSEHIDEVRKRKALEEKLMKQKEFYSFKENQPTMSSSAKELAKEKKDKKEKAQPVTKKSTVNGKDKKQTKDKKTVTKSRDRLTLDLKNLGDLIDEIEKEDEAVEPLQNLSQDALFDWLEDNNLSDFKPLFDPSSSPLPTPTEEESFPYYNMFARVENTNNLYLEKCNRSQLLNFLLLPEDSPLRQIWNVKIFLRDFILTHQAIMKIEQLFKFLSLICGSMGSSASNVLLTKEFINYLLYYLKLDLYINPNIKRLVTDLSNSLMNVNAEVAKSIFSSLDSALNRRFSVDFSSSSRPPTARALINNTLALNAPQSAITISNITISSSKPPSPRTRRALSARGSTARISRTNSRPPSPPRYPTLSSSTPPSSPRRGLSTNIDEESSRWLKFFSDRLITDMTPFMTESYEISKQLTVVEQRYCHSIEITEFLNRGWTNPDTPTPNLDRFIEWTNKVSGWITREILVHSTPNEQADVISLFIDVGSNLLKLNNFNGVNEVLASLHSPPISKLKKAWGLVPKKSREDLSTLTTLMSPDNHYHAYFETLSTLSSSVPAVPFLSPTLRDLYFIEEAHETVRTDPDGWINWYKMAHVGRVIWNFRKFSEKFDYRAIPVFTDFFENKMEFWGGRAAYEIAKMREEFAETKPLNLPKPSSRNTGEEIDWFNISPFTEPEMQLILLGTDNPVTYEPNTDLITLGSPCDKLYYLDSGELQISSQYPNSSDPPVCVSSCQKNCIVGLESILKSYCPDLKNAGLVTVSHTSSIRQVNIAHILKTMKKESDLNLKLTKILAGRLAIYSRFRKISQNKMEDGDVLPKLEHIELEKINLQEKKKKKGKKSKKPIFEEEFQLDGDIVIKEFSCNYHKSITGTIQGTLFVTQNHLCFAAFETFNWMKGGQKLTIDPTKIGDIQQKGKSIIIIRQHKGKLDTVEFSNFKKETLTEIYEFLKGFWHQKLSKSPLEEKPQPGYVKRNSEQLSQLDWEKFDGGADIQTFGSGDVILYPSLHPDRCVYIVKQGKAKIEYENGEEADLAEGSVFGIETFLLNSSETSKVTAIEENTKIYKYEGYFIDLLESYYTNLVASFYLFLAIQIASKL